MKKSKSDMALAAYEERPWLKWYPKDVPADIEIPKKSVTEMVDQGAEKWGGKTAVIFYGNKMEHKEIRELSLRFATALHDLGIRKGDRVGILLPNCPQFMIAYYGILRLGATATTLSPLYTPREIKHQINDTDSETLVVLDLLFEKVEKVWEETGLKHVIITSIAEYFPGRGRLFGKLRGKTLETEVSSKTGVIQFQDLIQKYPPHPPNVEIDPEDIAALPYTGGTTGLPKGAVLSHRNIVTLNEQIRRFFPEIEDGKEVGLAVMPFYHIYGQSVIMLTGAFRGGTGVVFSRPDIDEILDSIEKYGVTIFYGVPTLYKYLADHSKTKRINWKKVKYFFSGADTLHKKTLANWMRETGREIFEGYGSTETSGVTHAQPYNRNRPGTLGIPLPNTHAAVARFENNKFVEFLPPGQEGEIVVSGPQVQRGFWRRPEENKISFFEAGGRVWFRIGDMGSMDEEGYFHFVERTKDMIKYKGLSVYPSEIEDVLFHHPKIKEAAVIGVPDPVVGERVKAIVVAERDYRGKISEEEVMKYCEDKLAHYKVPKIVEFRGEIPKTDVMKVDHKKLRAELFRLEEK